MYLLKLPTSWESNSGFLCLLLSGQFNVKRDPCLNSIFLLYFSIGPNSCSNFSLFCKLLFFFLLFSFNSLFFFLFFLLLFIFNFWKKLFKLFFSSFWMSFKKISNPWFCLFLLKLYSAKQIIYFFFH